MKSMPEFPARSKDLRSWRLAWVLLLFLPCCGGDDKIVPPGEDDGPAPERLFQPNRLALAIRNDGSRDFSTGDALTYDGAVVLNDLGLWIGTRVDGEIRVSATSYYGSEFRPLALGAGDSTALVYVRRPGDHPGDPDYDTWPVGAGAPADSSCRPLPVGSGIAWTACDDLDPAGHTRFGSAPIGAVVRITVWGYSQPDSVLFLRMEVENTGDRVWENTLLGVWADADVGDAQNDLAGSDVDRGMGYQYTAPEIPETRFGVFQPAVGIELLETPADAGFHAFPRIWKAESEPRDAAEAYHLLQGLNPDGSACEDSTTGEAIRFTASGDPVAGTGSIEHIPADRRMLIVTGPLPVEPGGRLSLTYAILFARDRNALTAITGLRTVADAVAGNRSLWDPFGQGGACE